MFVLTGPSGGLLADDCGLGKTLETIALIKQADDMDKFWQRTLIVVPRNLYDMWKRTLTEELSMKGETKFLIEYYGPNRFDATKNIKNPENIRIVLTTNGTLLSDYKHHHSESILFSPPETWFKPSSLDENIKITYDRLVVDEAHKVNNETTGIAEALIGIRHRAEIPLRWAITATPYENKITELKWLALFIGAYEGPSYNWWQNFNEEDVTEYIPHCVGCNTRVKINSDRWTKRFLDEYKFYYCPGCQKYEGKTLEDIHNTFGHETGINIEEYQKIELSNYQMAADGLNKVQQWLKVFMIRRTINQVKSQLEHEIGEIKWYIVPIKLTTEEQAHYDKYRPESVEQMKLYDSRQRLSKKDTQCLLATMNKLAVASTAGSKYDTVRKIYEALRKSNNQGAGDNAKIVVFSKYLTKLKELREWLGNYDFDVNHLLELEKEICMFHGEMSIEKQNKSLENFRDHGRFLFVTIQCGYGLDFSMASNVIFLEPHFNPHAIEQAWCRVYRFGQKNPVKIWILVAKDTIEEYMVMISKRKAITINTYRKNFIAPAFIEKLTSEIDEQFPTMSDIRSLIKEGFLKKEGVCFEEAVKTVNANNKRKRESTGKKMTSRKRKKRLPLVKNPDGKIRIPCILQNGRGMNVTIKCFGDGEIYQLSKNGNRVKVGFKSFIMRGDKYFVNTVKQHDKKNLIFEVRIAKKTTGETEFFISNEPWLKKTKEEQEKALEKYGKRPQRNGKFGRDYYKSDLNPYRTHLYNNGIFQTPSDVVFAAFRYNGNGQFKNNQSEIAVADWFGFNHPDIQKMYDYES